MPVTTRRQFLHASLVSSAGLILGSPVTSAIEPIVRTGKPQLRLSIAAYSYHRLLDLNQKPKPAMTMDDFIDLAAEMKLDAVEPTSYYFPETTPEYLDHIKDKCAKLGLAISGTAVANDFCTPDAAKLKKDLDHVKKWVDIASRLGAKTIRIFAGSLGKDDSEDKARARCVAAIEEACDYAGKAKIFLGLENHGGITSTAEQMLAIVKAVKHPWFGVNLDTGNFHGDDPYEELAQLAPYAVTVQVKTEIQRKGKKKEPADLARLIELLKKVNYQGYVALEYEAEEDPRKAIPGHVEELKKLVR